MKIYGVTIAQLEEAAQAVNARLNETEARGSRVPYVKTTIRPLPGCIYRAVSPGTGRKVNALDFCGHAAFFVEVYKRAPGAKIVSAFATFNSAADLRAQIHSIADRNIGSRMYPVTALEACTEESGDAYGAVLDALQEVCNN